MVAGLQLLLLSQPLHRALARRSSSICPRHAFRLRFGAISNFLPKTPPIEGVQPRLWDEIEISWSVDMAERNSFNSIEEMNEHLATKKSERVKKLSRKGLFSNKTPEELNDRAITPLWELRTRTGIGIGVVLAAIGILFHACSSMDFERGSTYSAQLCNDRKDDLHQAMIRRQFGQASSGDIRWQTKRMMAACE